MDSIRRCVMIPFPISVDYSYPKELRHVEMPYPSVDAREAASRSPFSIGRKAGISTVMLKPRVNMCLASRGFVAVTKIRIGARGLAMILLVRLLPLVQNRLRLNTTPGQHVANLRGTL